MPALAHPWLRGWCVSVCVCVCACVCVRECVWVKKYAKRMKLIKQKITNRGIFKALHQIEPQAPLLVVTFSPKWLTVSERSTSNSYPSFISTHPFNICYVDNLLWGLRSKAKKQDFVVFLHNLANFGYIKWGFAIRTDINGDEIRIQRPKNVWNRCWSLVRSLFFLFLRYIELYHTTCSSL